MPEFAHVGDFCPNEDCPDYGKLQVGQSKKNIKKSGKTRTGKQLLGSSTAYVERTHLTSRHFNSRLVRKTLGYSKILRCTAQPLLRRTLFTTWCVASKRYALRYSTIQCVAGSHGHLPWLAA
jgi:hypothetical protein